MTDSQGHDPFRPPAPATTASEPLVIDSEDFGQETAIDSFDDDELQNMRRTELIRLAQREGVASYGTKDELIHRIRSNREDQG